MVSDVSHEAFSPSRPSILVLLFLPRTAPCANAGARGRAWCAATTGAGLGEDDGLFHVAGTDRQILVSVCRDWCRRRRLDGIGTSAPPTRHDRPQASTPRRSSGTRGPRPADRDRPARCLPSAPRAAGPRDFAKPYARSSNTGDACRKTCFTLRRYIGQRRISARAEQRLRNSCKPSACVPTTATDRAHCRGRSHAPRPQPELGRGRCRSRGGLALIAGGSRQAVRRRRPARRAIRPCPDTRDSTPARASFSTKSRNDPAP